jgi:DNA-binding NtrC family response regulator/tetratricopeptide (TPR) repeat protein
MAEANHRRNGAPRGPGARLPAGASDGAPTCGPPDEVDRLVQVAELHLAADDTQAAIEALARAEGLASPAEADISRLVELKLRMAECLRARGEFSVALTQLDRALDLLDDQGDAVLRGKAMARAASLHVRLGDYGLALKTAAAAYDLLRATGEHAELGALELTLGTIHMRAGRVKESQECFESALFTFRRINNREGTAKALNNLGMLLTNGPRWRDALDYLRQTLAISEELGNAAHVAAHCINLGILCTKLCEWKEAERTLVRGVSTCREIGNNYAATCGHLALGNLQRRRGRHLRAAESYAQARHLAEEHKYGRESVLCWEFEGDLLADQGKLEEARDKLERGLEMAKAVAPKGDLAPEIERRLAQVVLRLGDPAQAERLATRAYRGARHVGDSAEAGAALRVLGDAYGRQGKHASAGRVLQRAVEILAQTPEQYELALARICWGRHLGRPEPIAHHGESQAARLKATELLQRAIEFFLSVELIGLAAEAVVELAELRAGQRDLEGALRDIARGRNLAEQADRRDVLERLDRTRAVLEMQSAEATVLKSPEVEIIQDWSRFFSEGGADEARLEGMLRFALERLESSRVLLAAPAVKGGQYTVVAGIGLEKGQAEAILGAVAPHVEKRGLVLAGGLAHDSRFAAEADRIFAGVKSFAGLSLSLPEGKGILYIDRRAEGGTVYGRGDLRVLSVVSGLLGLGLIQVRRERELQEQRQSREHPARTGPLADYVTQDPELLRGFAQLERVGDSNASILVTGETGTGKGLLAQCIHRASTRRQGPFVSVNCAAIPETLLESELFGHVAGSFTGARSDKRGLFEEAEGGTLFLDEISRTSLTVQAKLLHALDTHKIRRVGATRDHAVNVRVVCASNTDLAEAIRRGTFLEDLFYRLSDFTVHLPPLRERPADIPLLITHFYGRICRELGRQPAGIDTEVRRVMLEHAWRGNIRELIQVVRRLVALSLDGERITTDLLPRELLGVSGPADTAAVSGGAMREDAVDGGMPGGIGPGRPAGAGPGGRDGKSRALREEVLRLERRLVSETLVATGWNRAETARRLRISYPTLLAKIKMFGLTQVR